MRISSGDVCEIARISTKTLVRWIEVGMLRSAPAKQGKGQHHNYSRVDVLAVLAGARWRASGASPERVAGVVRFVSGMTLEHLEAEFAAGRTFPVPVEMLGGFELPKPGGILIAPEREGPVAPIMAKLDLAEMWAEVNHKIAKLTSQAAKKPRKRGRLRGTARQQTK